MSLPPEQLKPCGQCSYCKGERGTDGCKWADQQRWFDSLRRDIERRTDYGVVRASDNDAFAIKQLFAEIDRLRLELAEKDKLIAELRQPKARGHCEICGGMIFADYGHSCPSEHANARIAQLERDLTAAREEIAAIYELLSLDEPEAVDLAYDKAKTYCERLRKQGEG